jgi:hypothetical protein
MPVFHSYVNDDGYYITARPSDVGNITYQTTKEADQLLSELGYGDEDELPWGIINPLRSADLIYTNNQGVDRDREDAPDLDPSKLPELTESEVQKLLDYFSSRGDIPDHICRQLEEKIESSTEDMLDKVGSRFHSKFPNHPTHVYVTWKSDNQEEINAIEIEIQDENITHYLRMRGGGPTVDEWEVEHPYDESWEGMAKAYETRPKIMRALGEINAELPYEITWCDGLHDGFII